MLLAKEWHTVDAVLYIDWLLRQAACRQQVTLFWNANNTFGFDRIPWERLAQAATITTVSHYMKHLMWNFGVNPLVIPNGLTAEALRPPERQTVTALRARTRGRTVLSKVARWDPDKRWLLAVETIGILKYQGWRPLLVARGSVEAHGMEVLEAAAAAGLRVVERLPEAGVRGLLAALEGLEDVDIVSLRTRLDVASRRVLFRSAAGSLGEQWA